jgi:hypothetical protein
MASQKRRSTGPKSKFGGKLAGRFGGPLRWSGKLPSGEKIRRNPINEIVFERAWGHEKVSQLLAYYAKEPIPFPEAPPNGDEPSAEYLGTMASAVYEVLLHVLRDCVPDFRLDPRGQRPGKGRTWDTDDDVTLERDILLEKKRGAKSDAQACERLTVREPRYTRFRNDPKKLEKRLSEWRSRKRELSAGPIVGGHSTWPVEQQIAVNIFRREKEPRG